MGLEVARWDKTLSGEETMGDAGRTRQGWPDWVEQWVLPYVDDIALWPVLFALLGHVLVVIVPLMLQVYRHGSSWAVLILLLLSGATMALVRMEHVAKGRFGMLSLVMLITWSSSLPFAWFAERTGVL
jgi:hypothetical protein